MRGQETGSKVPSTAALPLLDMAPPVIQPMRNQDRHKDKHLTVSFVVVVPHHISCEVHPVGVAKLNRTF